MSGRVLAAGLRPLPRRAAVLPVRHLHRQSTGGLLQADAAIRATRKRMWQGGNAFHNAVTTRNASFARFLPKLMVKFLRVPAMISPTRSTEDGKARKKKQNYLTGPNSSLKFKKISVLAVREVRAVVVSQSRANSVPLLLLVPQPPPTDTTSRMKRTLETANRRPRMTK
ncbi:hypothetical protein LB505_004031 [Fusarium chuoi]|nr:hypothetical protein LB505_004031 [Fusarium chuoi]